MGAYQKRQSLLLGAGEAGQVGVLDEIGAVTMKLAVGDRQADFMHLGCPVEKQALLFAELPGVPDLIEGGHGGRCHIFGMDRLDAVAPHQQVDAVAAGILGSVASDQVEQHAFTQCAVGIAHAFQVEGFEDRTENGNAGREDPRPILLEAFHRDLIQVAEADQLLAQFHQGFALDQRGVTIASGGDDRCRGLDRATGADRILPSQLVVMALDVGQFGKRGHLGAPEALFAELAVGEKGAGIGHAAHVEAFQRLRFEVLTDDELGGTAADIDDQAPAVHFGQRMSGAEVDQARLFAAADDLDGVADQRFGAIDQRLGVMGCAKGIGADDTQVGGRDALEKRGEALEAAERTIHGDFGKVFVSIEAGGKLYFLAHLGDDLELAVLVIGDQQVEAVGTEIDSGQTARRVFGGRIPAHGVASSKAGSRQARAERRDIESFQSLLPFQRVGCTKIAAGARPCQSLRRQACWRHRHHTHRESSTCSHSGAIWTAKHSSVSAKKRKHPGWRSSLPTGVNPVKHCCLGSRRLRRSRSARCRWRSWISIASRHWQSATASRGRRH